MSQPNIHISQALRDHMAAKNEAVIAVDIIDCVS